MEDGVLTTERDISGRSRAWRGIREGLLVATATLLYSLVRGLTDDRVDLAFENAERVISFQSTLGFFVESDMQAWIADNDVAINIVNAIYIGGYWPVLIGTLAWLLVRHPDHYTLYRNALLASGAITLVIFALYPLAPPRFLPEQGFIDTVAENSETYRNFTASPFVNEYAAMPSLHFGWILLLSIAWIAVSKRRIATAFGVIMPISMFAAIVLSGNHFIIDGIVGGIVVLAGLGIAYGIERWKEARRPAQPMFAAARAPSPHSQGRSGIELSDPARGTTPAPTAGVNAGPSHRERATLRQ
ncbi:phosphatase PAP2 family protein [Actinobacteria bacterium YIM 96077]|uniref:Inositolphosphotransferase Aur1/Ipt1 domain-containing protein n=1 Tax=Phytoactinopolyspora halophila TaxID=1981511 RepID=A0A329QL78_9ACTN|nr:phosphatase PAP2 family protein [Phytoactinopolyspora halophila]AYY14820.1 phosphatase PAP2 family protein [Actinobacteria bacterium YIM 96077]RAW13094.1 hypothetical protein DPM12_13545 [Phytoactinopolyspora halophila]